MRGAGRTDCQAIAPGAARGEVRGDSERGLLGGRPFPCARAEDLQGPRRDEANGPEGTQDGTHARYAGTHRQPNGDEGRRAGPRSPRTGVRRAGLTFRVASLQLLGTGLVQGRRDRGGCQRGRLRGPEAPTSADPARDLRAHR